METMTSLSPKTIRVILYVIVIGIAIFRLMTISTPSLRMDVMEGNRLLDDFSELLGEWI